MQRASRRILAASFVAVLASSACNKAETERPKRTANPPAQDALGVGDAAPDVTLKLHDGKNVQLSSLKDSMVLLYFYPKDDTPGCTVEAQGLRDKYEELTEAGVKVFGISLQDAASHKAFIDKYDLPFPLVVDDGSVAGAFEVPVRKGIASRQSFLIGKDGKLIAVWRSVSPDGHADEVLKAAKAAPG